MAVVTQTSTPVTPEGVRDGEPRSLVGLAQRRAGSVLDYGRYACGASVAADAAAEAFARFRAAVVAADDPVDLAPDALLLSCTRHAAAAFAPVADVRPNCPATPYLIVGRFEGSNVPAEEARLTKHLATCAACADRARAFDEAERAFRAPHPATPDGAIVERIVTALRAAAPLTYAGADAPVVPAPQDEDEDEIAAVVEADAPPAATDEEPALIEDEPDPFAPAASPEGPEDEDKDKPRPVAGRRTPVVVPRIVVPAGIVTTAVIGAMAIAGVFGGTSPQPARGESDLPSPVPPARPSPADDETTARTVRAAREALRRIEARERVTAQQALAAAAAPDDEAEEATEDDTPTTTGSTGTPGAGAGTSRPTTTTPRPPATPRPRQPSTTQDGDSEIETVAPQGDAGADDGTPSFEPGQTP